MTERIGVCREWLGRRAISYTRKTTNNTTDPHHFRREQNEQICERTMDNDPPPVKPWSDVNKTFLQELIDAAVLPLLLSSRREEAQEEEG